MRGLLRRFRPIQAAAADSAVRSTSRTHLGRVRKINEDRVLERADSGLWAVADGMGGHSRGDVAAETLVTQLSALTAPIAPQAVAEALHKANREIFRLCEGKSGTTLVMLTIDRATATIRWAGDSRAYLIRDERLQQLTRDHSVVQELVDAGLVEGAQSARHPQANVITRALGTAPEAALDELSIELEPGDRVLLCSDGLSRTLDERDVRGRAEIESLADRLLACALERDASDNISLVIIEAN